MSTLHQGDSLSSDPSLQKAGLNVVGWGWVSPDAFGYVVTERIEEARAAISAGHRVIPVYESGQEVGL